MNSSNIELCNRCKTKQVEFFCKDCSPFNKFCSNCDTFIHSLPSKREHQRELIHQNYNDININDSTLPFSNNSFQSQVNSHSKYITQNPIYIYENNINSFNENKSQRYNNRINKIYDEESNDLFKKNLLLQKELNNTHKKYESQILDLKNIINELKNKNSYEIKKLIEEYDNELKRIINEKDNEINYLNTHNFELEKQNNELVNKLNEYSELMNKNTNGLNEKVNDYENTIISLQKDNNNMKDFYEKKLNFFSQNFSSERDKIINSYEDMLEKLNSNNNDSKEKYYNIINERENEIKDLINKHKNETDNLKHVIIELQKQLEEIRLDQENLIQLNEELKNENDILNDYLDMAKKEIKFHIKEKRKIDENCKDYKSEYDKLKYENKKMQRLSHGKFKKNK